MDKPARKIEVTDGDASAETQEAEAEDQSERIDADEEVAEAPAEEDAEDAEAPESDDGETIAELKAEIERLEEALEEEHDRRLRAVAELRNFKRRTAKERQERARYAGQEVLSEILPVMDNLQRVLEHEAEAGTEDFATGVRMTVEEFFRILDQLGVTVLGCEGEPFDPAVHDAVARVETDEVPEGTVVEVDTPGYCLHDRCLRPARVVVAKGDEDEESAS